MAWTTTRKSFYSKHKFSPLLSLFRHFAFAVRTTHSYALHFIFIILLLTASACGVRLSGSTRQRLLRVGVCSRGSSKSKRNNRPTINRAFRLLLLLRWSSILSHIAPVLPQMPNKCVRVSVPRIRSALSPFFTFGFRSFALRWQSLRMVWRWRWRCAVHSGRDMGERVYKYNICNKKWKWKKARLLKIYVQNRRTDNNSVFISSTTPFL